MEDVLTELKSRNPNAVLLEPRELFDSALMGVTDSPRDQWERPAGVVVAVYDTEACIEALMSLLDSDRESATEWFYYNTAGAWFGEGTPTFQYRGGDD